MCMCALCVQCVQTALGHSNCQMSLWCWWRSISLCWSFLQPILIDSFPIETFCYNIGRIKCEEQAFRGWEVLVFHIEVDSQHFFIFVHACTVSDLTPARQALCHCAASSTHFLLCIWRQVCTKQFKMTLNSPCRSCRPWMYCSQSLISRVAGITGLQTGLARSMAYVNPLQYKSHAARNSSIVNVLFLTFGSECL